jgi:serine/threonine-protein kinase
VPDRASASETVLAGRYRLVRPIARGGMAEVWEGHDVVLDRPVAVKLLHAHLASDETFLERFRREAVAAAGLAHRNVISTFDTGNDQGHAFIVMELVVGQTLAAALAAGPLPPAHAIRIAAEVADALEYAHRAGMVHRDVKPANILLFDDGRVKVSDFGIAKAMAGGDLTQTGTMLGTTKYVSPEQVEGKVLDGRSDVYSLGVVLYEMLCGKPPFEADTDMATALMHVRSEPKPLGQVCDVPAQLADLVRTAMAKSPAQRFPSAAAMREALLRIDPSHTDATAFIPRPAARTVGGDTAIDRTPPAGIVPKVSVRHRSLAIPLAVVAVVAVAVGVLVFALSSPQKSGQGNGAAAQTSIPITRVSAFDPFGDGEEHNADVGNLTDGRPETTWRTETYADALQKIKKGVGLIIESGGVARHLVVSPANSGWSAQVYVADRPASTLDGWGAPVTSRSGIRGEVSFDLGRRSGHAVLLWFTDLGDGNVVALRELRLTG